ncbi:MAG: hypothetical protein J0M02_01025 [Planctomycetes bacterium]|nr:hypothetical protein [Planctomycetota bacterium]
MSDRAYARFTVPMSVLADPAKAEAIRSAFGFSTADFQSTLLSEPLTQEASGHESFTVRLVDRRPCLVYEEEDCNYGGADIEDALCAAQVPFIQVNAAGDEYGPSSTVYDGETSEIVRLDHNLEPIVGIGVVDGRATVDAQEVTDYERYLRLRRSVLLYPAVAA